MVDLEWFETIFADDYLLEIATDPNFSNIIISEILSGNSYSASDLAASTTYYWRVLGINVCGEGAYSSTFSFNTGNIDCAPLAATDVPIEISLAGDNMITSVINIPTAGTVTDLRVFEVDITHSYVGDLTVTLTSPAGTTITLLSQLGVPASDFGCSGDDLFLNFDDMAASTAADLENTCNTLPAADGTFQPVNPLSTFTGEDITGDWILTVIDNVSDDGGSLNGWQLDICASSIADVSLNPESTFYEVCQNETLSFDVSIGPGFSNTGVILSASGQPNGSVVNFSQNPASPGAVVTVTISNINQQGNFDLALLAVDGVNEVEAMISLNVVSQPAAVVLLSPADGATDQPIGTVLSWQESTDASTYQIVVATDPAFNSIIVDEESTSTSLNLNGLLANTTYYWMVTAINDCGASQDNETSNFTTIPDLSFTADPPNREACQVQSPGFTLNISDGFNDPVSISYEVTPAQPIEIDFSIDPANVPPGSTVTAFLTNLITIPVGTYMIEFMIDDGENTNQALVTLSLGEAPTLPNMVSPNDGQSIMADNVSFSWETVDNATEYQIEIARDDAFTNIISAETVVATSFDLDFQESGTYYWRVTAINNCGEATPIPFNFTLETSSTGELNGRTVSFQPNPTSDQLNISLSAPLPGAVQLNIFTVNGQLLGSHSYGAATSTMQVDLSAYPAGVYLVRLVNAEASLVRRIIVQR